MYENWRRLETELLSIARDWGYDGWPFLRDTPQIGFAEQEQAAIDLSLAVQPLAKSPRQKSLLRRWARNIVLSSSARSDNSAIINAKLDRVRRRRGA